MKNPGLIEFDAEIKSAAAVMPNTSGGAYIEFPFDMQETFETRGRVKVKAHYDGVEYRGSLVNMGLGCHILGITKAIYKQIGKQIGDTVHVTLQVDEEPRVLEIPADFQEALSAEPAAQEFFDKLAYSHRREYVLWINEAKREETRRNRIQKAVQMLGEQKKLR
ncbi:MAG: YdeI/OmpD-associated family protein [Anaerolineaceae bacterium]